MLFGGVFEDVFGEEVFDLGLVAEHLEVGGFEQLRAAVVELLADGLLDAGVVDFALAGGFAADELVDGVADRLCGCRDRAAG